MHWFDDYWVGEHLLPALINGDVSGLEPSDELALERFVAELQDVGYMVWVCDDIEGAFARCEVTSQFNMCHKVGLWVGTE